MIWRITPRNFTVEALEESLEIYSNKELFFSKVDNEELEASPGLGRIQYIFELTLQALKW